jgi:hypothetical protein
MILSTVRILLPVVLYGCETWSLTLREEHRLRVFENRMLVFRIPDHGQIQKPSDCECYVITLRIFINPGSTALNNGIFE